MSDVLARLAEIEAQLTAVRAVAFEAAAAGAEMAELGEETRGRLLDLLKKLFGGWQNIDAAELEAIIAKATEATAFLLAGRYVAAAVATMAVMRLYMDAIKTPVPGPIV